MNTEAVDVKRMGSSKAKHMVKPFILRILSHQHYDLQFLRFANFNCPRLRWKIKLTIGAIEHERQLNDTTQYSEVINCPHFSFSN